MRGSFSTPIPHGTPRRTLRGPSPSFRLRHMSFLRSALLLFCLALAGCDPGSPSGDEQKESHFIAATKRVQERDFDGAIELFEKSLDVNPRSASAHFELGILYQQQRNDFAAALYHLQKAVALRPDSSTSALAKQQ